MGFKSDNIFRGNAKGKRAWEPDEEFDHTDFSGTGSSRTPKDTRNQQAPSRKVSPDRPVSPGKSDRKVQAYPSQEGNQNPGGGLKTWNIPRVDSSNSNVLRHDSQEKPGSQGAGSQTGNTVRPGKVIGNTTPVNAPRVLPDRFIRNAIYSHPERSIELLRSWYWEKKNTGMGESYRRIHPHLRIFIVLSSAGTEAVRFLYSLFTPTERKQIHGILKSFPPVDPREVDLVRRAFIEKITMDF